MASKSKKSQPKKVVKAKLRKALTLKQKNAKESKVVKVDSLLWKPVDIPDNLDDYEGLYGLEELDGVDVKIVDGKAQFTVKDESLIKPETNPKNEVADQPESDVDMDDESDEFTGFDDDEDIELPEASELTVTKPKSEKAPKSKKQSKPEIKSSKHTKEEEEEAEEAEEEEAKTETKSNKTSDSKSASKKFDLKLPVNVKLPEWEEVTSLSPYTLNGLKSLGFNSPTEIQKRTISLAIEGKDIIGKATTGSGKTLAYGIPILERYLANMNKSNTDSIKPPTGVIFCPTRELTHQVVDHLTSIARYTPLSQHGIVSITGGLSIQKQERLLAHGPAILVATPGRCLELLQKDPALVERIASTEIIVLDEADRLLQDGHFEEFEKIISLLGKNRPKSKELSWKWQTLVFSATFSKDLFSKLDKNNTKNKVTGNTLMNDDEIINLLSSKLQFKSSKPLLIDANPKEIVAGNVTEALVECGATERDLYLYYFLLMYPGTTLVFANAIDSVKRLVPFLNNLKIPAFSIHSSMIQRQRLRALEKFRQAGENNETSVLIATDVAARGLDIPSIDHVAHYHLPRSADVYIHRSGRTARAGNEGVSVMFCSPQEASGPLRKLRKVVASNKASGGRMQTDVKLLPIEMEILSKIKRRATISAKLADAAVSNTSTKKEESWVTQAAMDLGIDELSDVEEFEDDMLKKQRLRKEKKMLPKEEQQALRFELKELLATQIRKSTRRSYITSGVDNLAHQMVSGAHHDAVLGHQKVNALQDLKGGKSAKVNKPGSNKIQKLQNLAKAKKEKKDQKKRAKEAKRKNAQLTNAEL
jgi:ATP-dependent RNA helicase DDX24/MAK5